MEELRWRKNDVPNYILASYLACNAGEAGDGEGYPPIMHPGYKGKHNLCTMSILPAPNRSQHMFGTFPPPI